MENSKRVIDVITENNSTYRLDFGHEIWAKAKRGRPVMSPERLRLVQKADDVYPNPMLMPWAEGAEEVWADGLPEVGQLLHVSAMNGIWFITTPVVEIREVENFESDFTGLSE